MQFTKWMVVVSMIAASGVAGAQALARQPDGLELAQSAEAGSAATAPSELVAPPAPSPEVVAPAPVKLAVQPAAGKGDAGAPPDDQTIQFDAFTLVEETDGSVTARLPFKDVGRESYAARRANLTGNTVFYVDVMNARVNVRAPDPIGFLTGVRTGVYPSGLRRLSFVSSGQGVIGEVEERNNELVIRLRAAKSVYEASHGAGEVRQPSRLVRSDSLQPVADYQAVDRSKEWQGRGSIVTPGPDGSVIYRFGEGQPVIVCALLRICDLELQPGEVVNGVPQLGDSTRWIVTPVVAGTGDNAVSHLIIKPTEAGLVTNMIIPTNRRIYNLRLESLKYTYVARTAFSYPEDERAAWEKYQQRAVQKEQAVVVDLPPVTVDNLYFMYRVEGDTDNVWTPTRVFDDGAKTYIQLRGDVQHQTLPALVLVGDDDKEQVVNYRVNKGYVIVDRLFKRAALILGVGGSQAKVTISRVDRPGELR